MAVTTGVRSESQWRAEAAALRPLFADLGGRIAVQVGVPACLCLDRARFTAVFPLDCSAAEASVRARADLLPLPSSSIDVVLLMHVLDGTTGRGPVIREAARVLRGEGRLIVVGLRPLSPAGFASWLRGLRAGLQPGGAWGLRALLSANGFVWQGRRRIGGIYAASGIRRIPCMRPLRPFWLSGTRTHGSTLEVPGAGHAG